MKKARDLHQNVPPDWYYRSIKKNLLQRFWHQRRFEEAKKMISPAKRVLDIGSADGVFSKVILDKSKADQVVGIDVLESSVDWANKHWRTKKMKFQVGDAHNLKFGTNYFDAVFAMEMLEHAEDPQKVFKEIKRVLKKGGYFVALVPTDSLLFEVVWFLWKKGRGRIWEDTHLQSFSSKNTLARNIRQSGFKIEEDKKFLLGMLNLVKARKI